MLYGRRMKSEADIKFLLTRSRKEIEHELDMKIRNGQATEGIRKALNWVLSEKYSIKVFPHLARGKPSIDKKTNGA
jgi:hypothetical protein